jgi:flagellar hook-associated protein 3 FlgL
MVYRISTVQAFNSGVNAIQRNYSTVTGTQQQISSGKRIQTPADDPVASVRLLQLDQQQAVLAQYGNNLTAAKNSLSEEETLLNSSVNVLQRVRELTVQAGGGALSAEDRKAIAQELQERELQLLGLMNSRNSRGDYLFSGYLGKTQPFIANPDGTYSYQGDSGQRSLQISGSTTVAINDNGQRIFEEVTNADRVLNNIGVSYPTVPPLPPGTVTFPGVSAPDERVFLGPGLVQDNNQFNDQATGFRSGEPYSLVFDSGKSFRIYDRNGIDRTAEASNGGQINPQNNEANLINFRGMRFQLDVVLKPGDSTTNLDSLLADTATPGSPGINTHSFTLQAAPTDFSVARASTNTSSAVISGAGISNQTVFDAQFPLSGLVVRFTSPTAYNAYALPLTASSPVLASGTVVAPFPQNINLFGADFSVSAAPATGDEFTVQPAFQEQRSILNTISRLRQALEAAPSTSTGNRTVRDEVAIALTNLDNGMAQVLGVQTELGARLNLVDSTETDNEDVSLITSAVQSELRDLDYAEAISRLSLETTVLEAAQQSYVKVAGLSLFNFIR